VVEQPIEHAVATTGSPNTSPHKRARSTGACSPGGVSKGRDGIGPDTAHGALYRGVAADVAPFAQFSPQPHRGEAWESPKPLTQIWQEGIGALLLGRSRTIARRLKTTGDILADRLAVDAKLTGNGGNLQALPVKLQDSS
jgi:hypothetical protein